MVISLKAHRCSKAREVAQLAVIAAERDGLSAPAARPIAAQASVLVLAGHSPGRVAGELYAHLRGRRRRSFPGPDAAA